MATTIRNKGANTVLPAAVHPGGVAANAALASGAATTSDLSVAVVLALLGPAAYAQFDVFDSAWAEAGGGGGGASVGATVALALAALASAGISAEASRVDHVHPTTGLATLGANVFTLAQSIAVDNGAPDTVTAVATLTHTTFDAGSHSGIGTALDLAAMTGTPGVPGGIGPTVTAVRVSGVHTDSTGGASVSALVVEVNSAGTLAERLRVTPSGVTVTGDIVATGGFRQQLFFGLANVPAGDNVAVASSTPVQIGFGGNSDIVVSFIAPRAGSVTALGADLSITPAGSDLAVEVFKNGTLLNAALAVVLSDGGGTSNYNTFAKDLYAFAAGDLIDVRVRTASGWSATTADIGVSVEIEC